MKKFLRQLKALQPDVSTSLEQRILRDAKPSIVRKRSYSVCSFFVGTGVGLLIGLFLFSTVEPPKIVETPPPPKQAKPLELDRLIAQLDRRNRAWEKTTIPDYTINTSLKSRMGSAAHLAEQWTP